MPSRRLRLALLLLLLLASLACQAVMGPLIGRPEPSQTAVQTSPSQTSEVLKTSEVLQATPFQTSEVLKTSEVWETEALETPSPPLTPTAATPEPKATLTPWPTPTLGTPLPTANASDRRKQVKVFNELWDAVNEEYLYRDFNGLDWKAIKEETLPRIQAGMAWEDFYFLMSDLIYRLGDDHSFFLSPQDVKAEEAEYAGETDYVGIGILTQAIPERQRITVLLIFPGSPAEEAGLQVHDSILAVDGTPILQDESFHHNLLRGPEGSTAVLTVVTPGQEPRQITITRRRITAPVPVPYHLFTTAAGKRIGYIYLTTFVGTNIPGEVKAAFEALSAEGTLDGLILDNRHNSGGSSNILNDVMAMFANGRLGFYVQRDMKRALSVDGVDVGNSQSVPMVVMVGPDSVSYGEISSGILQDLGRAYLIGETTGGNVEILWSYDFSDGSRVWLAHETFRPLNHADANWEKTGIIPDETVVVNWDEVTLDTDPAIQAAIAHLSGGG